MIRKDHPLMTNPIFENYFAEVEKMTLPEALEWVTNHKYHDMAQIVFNYKIVECIRDLGIIVESIAEELDE